MENDGRQDAWHESLASIIKALLQPMVLVILLAAFMVYAGLANGDEIVGWGERLIRAWRGG